MWIDLENIMLCEVKYSMWRQVLYDISDIWSLKNNNTNWYINVKQKQVHRYRKQTCGYQSEDGREEGQIRGTGLIDENYYVVNRLAARIHYVAQDWEPLFYNNL